MPAGLAAEITTHTTAMATIGIGAGKDCHGQELVMHDMLAVYPGKKARIVSNNMDGAASIEAAEAAYAAAVKDGSFPDDSLHAW